MKIKGKKTEVSTVEVDVLPMEAVLTLKYACYDALHLPQFCYIHEGQIVENIEKYGGNHSWTERKVIFAAPSEQQIQAVTLFYQITNLVNDLLLSKKANGTG